ncbi:MAG: PhzF family phenazine biosynthesis protein, partial [Bacteroidota bacterium]
TVEQLHPDFRMLAQLESRGIIATAKGKDFDFISRGFFPQAGIDEDPVTGSAHTTLTPYWAKILGKKTMTARQISKRTGDLICTLEGDRILLKGQAVLYLIGKIQVK